jgi:trans-2,3-dihydro-3-hydroxyanthranilate isomerase
MVLALMRLPFVTLDVFTSRRFAGNPLAVVLDADTLTTDRKQMIAREFNLSETIFVMRPEDASNAAKVRIFFPTAEVPFAGHPTLGCAIFLAEQKNKPGCSFETEIRLETQVGVVPVRITRIAGSVPRGVFTAPVIPFQGQGELPVSGLAAQALGLEESAIGFGNHKIGLWQAGPKFLCIPLGRLDDLAVCQVREPYWSEMTKAAGVAGAYMYARAGSHSEADYRARFYAPAAGIPEDPATGAATVLMAAQLLASGEVPEGTKRLRLEQAYEMGRPSELTLEIDCTAGALTSVRVGGQAVQVMQGTLEI